MDGNIAKEETVPPATATSRSTVVQEDAYTTSTVKTVSRQYSSSIEDKLEGVCMSE